MRSVVILGSTGSIGTSALDVLEGLGEGYRLLGLAAGSRWETLVEQARRTGARWIALADPEACRLAREAAPEVEVWEGPEAIARMAAHPEVDVVVSAIVGAAALPATLAAVEAGKTVALANKETLVMAGGPVTAAARRSGATILPVDSEHSAVFQCLQAGRRNQLRRVILTASGGPFRDLGPDELARVTVKQALDHPTWQMGPKVTIDSATLMNKALEIVEARWLFDLRADQIEVMIHPESIVHSMVEFVDASAIAQLSPPDMRLPIQYALTYPDRLAGRTAPLSLAEVGTLRFETPDPRRFPALALGHRVAEAGGTTGAVLNAANEAAVGLFREETIRFDQIVELVGCVLDRHTNTPEPDLRQIHDADRWARQEVIACSRCCSASRSSRSTSCS